MKKTAIYMFLLTGMIFLTNPVFAQPPDGPEMQRFREHKTKYFNEKLELSEAEAEKFWELYEDLHNRRMKINEDEKSLLSYYGSNSAAMTDEEIDETMQEYLRLQKQRGDLTEKYHKSFVKIIGKRKTMQMYSLEREFRMHILREFQGRRDGHGRGQGRNR